jgi:hypothetical protein
MLAERGNAKIVLLIVLGLVAGAISLLVIAFSSLFSSYTPSNQSAGIPGCESKAVAFEMRDTYGKQLTALYSLVPTNYLKAVFFELRRAKQESAGPDWRICKGTYNSLLGSGTLTYKVTWYDPANPDDGRVDVEVKDASSPKTVELLRQALTDASAKKKSHE